MIYDEESRKAFVIVTINHPYWEKNEEDILCEDIIDDVELFKDQKDTLQDISKGYTYACSIEDAKKFLPVLPPTLSN